MRRTLGTSFRAATAPKPIPMRPTSIDRSRASTFNDIGSLMSRASSRREVLAITDTAYLQATPLAGPAHGFGCVARLRAPWDQQQNNNSAPRDPVVSIIRPSTAQPPAVNQSHAQRDTRAEREVAEKQEQEQASMITNDGSAFGDKATRIDQVTCRWGKKYFGNIYHAPKNYGSRFSRWYSKRYKMKKHRYQKRWRFRRYKMAAIANLPFYKMIRVNMLPEMQLAKRGGTKKSQSDVDAASPTLSSMIVQASDSAASSSGKSTYGARGMKLKRPKSKYQQ